MKQHHIIDMTGKTVLITGGSRGLGRSMALGFAAAGADLAIAGRKAESCDATAEEIRAMGATCTAHACHVGYWDQCDALVESVYAAHGKVDVLINNAGMSPLYDRPVDISEALYDKVLDVNLKGPFRLSAVIGERMIEAGGGSIINVSSGAAVRPRANVITYSAAKAGVNAMTEAFADALGPKVRVNCIMPGPFLTDISTAWDMDTFNERARTSIALERGGEPDEVVGAALYLASDHAAYTTAAIIRIDGGSH
ncbi:MAG: glucose 1-dehydrogenase [Minwuia sp.]|nr:glucose 1-dehydrogenase [Minwuia sp.]